MKQKSFLPKSYQTQKAYKKTTQVLRPWPTVDRADINDNTKVILKIMKNFQRSFYDMETDLYFQWYDAEALSYSHNRNIEAVEGHMETNADIANEIVKELIERGWAQIINVRYTPENKFGFWKGKKAKPYNSRQTGLVFNADKVEQDLYRINQKGMSSLFDF